MEDTKYASRSWALLTRDKGWIKPVLVLAAANFVPIAGGLGTSGYILEWARLTAWGIDASPKQKNVQVGTCIKSGWRAFVVSLGWGMCLALAMGILTAVTDAIPGVLGSLLAGLVSLAVLAAEVFAAVILAIACIRTAIYERIGAGYRIDRVFDMVRRDTRGFFHLVLYVLLWSLAASVVVFVIGLVIGISLVPVLISAGYGGSQYAILAALSQTIGLVIILALLLGYGLSIVMTACSLVFYNAVALWIRQFDVPEWGRSEDPLPQAKQDAESGLDERPQLPVTQTAAQAGESANEQAVPQAYVREVQRETAAVQPAAQEQSVAEYPTEIVSRGPLASEVNEMSPATEPAAREVPSGAGIDELGFDRTQADAVRQPDPLPDDGMKTTIVNDQLPPTNRLEREEEAGDQNHLDDDGRVQAPVEDVDDLYSQLYDVMHRNEDE